MTYRGGYRVNSGFLRSNDIIYLNMTPQLGNMFMDLTVPKTGSLTVITNMMGVGTQAKLTIINSTTYLNANNQASSKNMTLINSIIRKVYGSSTFPTLINSTILTGSRSSYPHDNVYLLAEGKIILKDGTEGLFNKTIPPIEPNSRLDVLNYVKNEDGSYYLVNFEELIFLYFPSY